MISLLVVLVGVSPRLAANSRTSLIDVLILLVLAEFVDPRLTGTWSVCRVCPCRVCEHWCVMLSCRKQVQGQLGSCRYSFRVSAITCL
jgi:hypothetical protein